MTTITDAELIGYLIGALDPAEHSAVESGLRTNSELTQRLTRLRSSLNSLEADRELPQTPLGLAERTVSRLAAYLVEHEPNQTMPSTENEFAVVVQAALDLPEPSFDAFAYPAPLPRAPRDAPEARIVGGRFRPDLLVACGIALFAGGLLFSAIGKVRSRNEVFACQNALRVTHSGLAGYADAHNDRYPQIGPDSTADSFAATLAASGQVPANFRPACPACPIPTANPTSSPAVGYTYTLGYRNPAGELIGPRRSAGLEEHDLVPISADYPVASAAPVAGPLCPHSAGMNVLFAGGNVRLATSPLIGPGGDHIFQNVFGNVGAGSGRTDIVLGRPGDRP